MKSWRGVQNNREYESRLALEIATTGLLYYCTASKASSEQRERRSATFADDYAHPQWQCTQVIVALQ